MYFFFQKQETVMGEANWKDWRPFVYGGLASIVAELGNKNQHCLPKK